MSNYLITGGLGFIGKHLSLKLSHNEDNHIIIVDSEVAVREDTYTKQLRKKDNITIIKEDVANYEYYLTDKIDYIFHLAAPVGPVGVLKYPNISDVIIGDMYSMVDIALNFDAKLMFMSTSEVYGQNPVFDQPEDIDKIVPSDYTVRLEYGVSKLLAEIALANIAKTNDLKYYIVRPFNIVGPGQNPDLGFVLPRFCKQALQNEPLTVYGDGSAKRTFTHVDDIIDAMLKIVDTEFYGKIFNVGNPANVVTIGELARMVNIAARAYSNGGHGGVSFIDPTVLHGKNFAEAWNKIPNIDRAKSLLGWHPTCSLEIAIVDTLQYEAWGF